MSIELYAALQVAAASINYLRFVNDLSFSGEFCWERSLVAPQALLAKTSRFFWCVHELGFLCSRCLVGIPWWLCVCADWVCPIIVSNLSSGGHFWGLGMLSAVRWSTHKDFSKRSQNKLTTLQNRGARWRWRLCGSTPWLGHLQRRGCLEEKCMTILLESSLWEFPGHQVISQAMSQCVLFWRCNVGPVSSSSKPSAAPAALQMLHGHQTTVSDAWHGMVVAKRKPVASFSLEKCSPTTKEELFRENFPFFFTNTCPKL